MGHCNWNYSLIILFNSEIELGDWGTLIIFLVNDNKNN